MGCFFYGQLLQGIGEERVNNLTQPPVLGCLRLGSGVSRGLPPPVWSLLCPCTGRDQPRGGSSCRPLGLSAGLGMTVAADSSVCVRAAGAAGGPALCQRCRKSGGFSGLTRPRIPRPAKLSPGSKCGYGAED